MTKEAMCVELCKDDIKKDMIEFLSDAEIKIDADELDIIVAELPDNEDNIEKRLPLEKVIRVWISDASMEHQIKDLMERPYGDNTLTDLCGSMEQILRKTEDDHVFSRMRILKSGMFPSSAHNYHLLIAVRLSKSISGYGELFQYIIDNVKKKLVAVGDFLKRSKRDSDEQYLFGDMQKKWILFGKFAEYYLKEKGLPEPGILTKLSAARYEGSESEARIYFTKKELDRVEKFLSASKGDRVIEEKNQRMIRKLMEISKRNQVYLYAEKDTDEKSGKTIHTVTELVQRRGKQDKDMDQDTYVKFSGFMHWSLFIEGREIFSYYHGDYRFNVSDESYAYIDQIKELEGIDQNMIEKLVEILHEQKHGAVAIVFDEKTDAKKEADRLCNVKRGTRTLANICYDKDNGWNKEQILAVSGIDGALFIDHTGKCLAIGVIVDGEAVKRGNVGRGARYNSIANYMELKQGCVGIVVSEDGMIDVIQKKVAAGK